MLRKQTRTSDHAVYTCIIIVRVTTKDTSQLQSSLSLIYSIHFNDRGSCSHYSGDEDSKRKTKERTDNAFVKLWRGEENRNRSIGTGKREC